MVFSNPTPVISEQCYLAVELTSASLRWRNGYANHVGFAKRKCVWTLNSLGFDIQTRKWKVPHNNTLQDIKNSLPSAIHMHLGHFLKNTEEYLGLFTVSCTVGHFCNWDLSNKVSFSQKSAEYLFLCSLLQLLGFLKGVTVYTCTIWSHLVRKRNFRASYSKKVDVPLSLALHIRWRNKLH